MSIIRWTASALGRLVQETTTLRDVVENLEQFNRSLDQKLIDIDEIKKNYNEKYDVTIHNDRAKMMPYHWRIGQTWSPTNPGHQKASKSFTNYASNMCN